MRRSTRTTGVDPYAPVEGTKYAGALHQDSSYMRLSKTVDLTGASAGELAFKLSTSLESGYDHVIVEAHTPGQDDWTTLPERDGKTTTTPPSECEPNGFLLQLHPFLEHYLGGAGCASARILGRVELVHRLDRRLGGRGVRPHRYAGQQVELSITYMTDPSTGGIGAFVDDTKVTVDGNTTADGFEGAESSWTVGSAPAGSPPNQGNWKIGEKLVNAFGGVSTEDSLLLGFGLEQLSDDASRKDLIDRALSGLIE